MKRRTQIEHAIAYGIMILLFTGMLGIAPAIVYYTRQQSKLANAPVDVLTNWTLTLDASHPYKPGDVISIDNKFTKLLDVTGESNRYLQCHKPHSNDWDALIPINVVKANQKSVKHGEITSDVALPLSIGILPNTCRIYFEVTYNVNKYHPAFLESNYTNEFTVESRPELLYSSPGETIIYGSGQNENLTSQIANPTTPIVIYRNSNPSSDTENSPSTVQPQSKPGLLQKTINKIESIL